MPPPSAWSAGWRRSNSYSGPPISRSYGPVARRNAPPGGLGTLLTGARALPAYFQPRHARPRPIKWPLLSAQHLIPRAMRDKQPALEIAQSGGYARGYQELRTSFAVQRGPRLQSGGQPGRAVFLFIAVPTLRTHYFAADRVERRGLAGPLPCASRWYSAAGVGIESRHGQ
jgi:hypothetical protein